MKSLLLQSIGSLTIFIRIFKLNFSFMKFCIEYLLFSILRIEVYPKCVPYLVMQLTAFCTQTPSSRLDSSSYSLPSPSLAQFCIPMIFMATYNNYLTILGALPALGPLPVVDCPKPRYIRSRFSCSGCGNLHLPPGGHTLHIRVLRVGCYIFTR